MQDSTHVKKEDRDLQQLCLQTLAAVHEFKLSNQPPQKASQLSNRREKAQNVASYVFSIYLNTPGPPILCGWKADLVVNILSNRLQRSENGAAGR